MSREINNDVCKCYINTSITNSINLQRFIIISYLLLYKYIINLDIYYILFIIYLFIIYIFIIYLYKISKISKK